MVIVDSIIIGSYGIALFINLFLLYIASETWRCKMFRTLKWQSRKIIENFQTSYTALSRSDYDCDQRRNCQTLIFSPKFLSWDVSGSNWIHSFLCHALFKFKDRGIHWEFNSVRWMKLFSTSNTLEKNYNETLFVATLRKTQHVCNRGFGYSKLFIYVV